MEALAAEQARLAAEVPEPEHPDPATSAIGGVFVCFAIGITGAGAAGDRAWAGACALRLDGRPRVIAEAVVEGRAGAPYEAGLLARREGPLLETALRALAEPPDVILVNATGTDHPRRAGLALHLGALLDVPSIGVTDRWLVARAVSPGPRRGDHTDLVLEGHAVGACVRVVEGTRPLFVSPGWRVSTPTAVELVLACTAAGPRTPAPLRCARRLARTARARRD